MRGRRPRDATRSAHGRGSEIPGGARNTYNFILPDPPKLHLTPPHKAEPPGVRWGLLGYARFCWAPPGGADILILSPQLCPLGAAGRLLGPPGPLGRPPWRLLGLLGRPGAPL